MHARRVVYRNADFTQTETVFVVRNSKTFTITVSSDTPQQPINRVPDYSTYQAILKTFEF